MISLNVTSSRHDIAEKSAHFMLNNKSLSHHKTMKVQTIQEENSCLFEKKNKKRRKVDGNLAPNLNHAKNKKKRNHRLLFFFFFLD